MPTKPTYQELLDDKKQEFINDAIQGECPLCGGRVALSRCLDCGEAVDAIEPEE